MAPGRPGCWTWTGGLAYAPSQRDRPYGVLCVGGRRWAVRRLVYLLWGLKPALGRRTVGTTCGNSLCVNPAHLVRLDKRKR